ncbi:MAG: UDP-N-acetylglucosamine 1-carboxyvinyltransferase [Myxococcales bacterium]|nr:UDP-N-acetylglucosamine 1-carboxyvinyltransferase [Myxococcales bacterium]
MDSIVIRGGRSLHGDVPISGSKNASLPILCASLLAEGKSVFRNVPDLRDIRTTSALLRHLGVHVEQTPGAVTVRNNGLTAHEAPYELVKQMRASVLVLGPLVARLGRARVSLPGGCAIGARPIDEHLRGLEAMGAHTTLDHGYVDVYAPAGGLRGASIVLEAPTVTGTENLMCAAVLAEGRTTLSNAAREPEVVELAKVLIKMGAKIHGAGTDVITIAGPSTLNPIEHSIVADRIEAGTFLVAAACTGGEIRLKGVVLDHLTALVAALRRAGVTIERDGAAVVAAGKPPFAPLEISTAPYPGFPTDMQAQIMVLMSLGAGMSTMAETIFENRFMHISELNRMGANIVQEGRVATVSGVERLQGAEVMATDLRASASLIIAGLAAEGTTTVRRVYHIDRGYEAIERKLGALGADISRIEGNL